MKRLIAASLIAPFALGLAACDVDQTQEGEMPEVEVGTEETTVEVPDVDVTMPDAKGTPVTGDE